MKKILSFWGGGIRGVFSTRLLLNVEKYLDEALDGFSFMESFDLYAGNSTGSIIALALAKGYSVGEIFKFYEQEGPRIFDRSTWRILSSIFGIRDDKYDSENLEIALNKYFGMDTIHALKKKIFIPTFSATENRMKFFTERDEEIYLLKDIARASSAAPTYFDPARIRPVGAENWEYYLDGGLGCNNPALCAFTEAQKIWKRGPEDIFLLSIGTGFMNPDYRPEDTMNFSLLDWAKKGIEITLDSVASRDGYILRNSVYADHPGNYIEFNTTLPPECAKMDDASPENMKRLIDLADQTFLYIKEAIPGRLEDLKDKLAA